MTRKDFEAIVLALVAAAPAGGMPAQWQSGCDSAREVIARNIADYCARTNPRFNRAKFFQACGVTDI